MASSCFLRQILFSSLPTNLPSRSDPPSPPFPKNLSCSAHSTASLSISSIGRLTNSRRKLSEVRSMATEKGKEEKKRVEIFDTEENLAVELAKYTADLSDKYCKEKGAFTVVVSGGSLIKSLRVVPKHHEDSNYKLAYDAFLSKVPIPPGNVYAINESPSAEAAAEDYETCLKHLVKTGVLRVSESTGFPKFDLMLLGMGPDGHVASLFPGHGLCDEEKRWVASVTDSPKPPSERITFTFPVINSSACVALVVCGSGKAEAVEAALKKTGDVYLRVVFLLRRSLFGFLINRLVPSCNDRCFETCQCGWASPVCFLVCWVWFSPFGVLREAVL
uniref:Glucosamine/galactosamine-6-phosphate isomerase domain-containing protein n=1 Tax=Brassica oleracea var. oleracea TaxID=109376 RepID=A0A0D3E1G5_BRAOL